jgi:hypothetical protein
MGAKPGAIAGSMRPDAEEQRGTEGKLALPQFVIHELSGPSGLNLDGWRSSGNGETHVPGLDLVRGAGIERSEQKGAGDGAPPGITLKNDGSSPQFFAGIKRAVSESFDRLNPEAQRSLAGLTVSARDKIPRRGVHHSDTPGTYDSDKDTVFLAEKPAAKAAKEMGKGLGDIVRHELGHPLDVRNKRVSQSREFSLEVGKAMKKLSESGVEPNADRDWRRIDKATRMRYQEELFADLAAKEFGAAPDKLGYLDAKQLPAFSGASELIRKRFFK